MNFSITIERNDDGRYVAECTDLLGCLSEAETIEETMENINEAIIGCLKSRLKIAGDTEDFNPMTISPQPDE